MNIMMLPFRMLQNRIFNIIGDRVYKITFAITFLCNSKCSICNIWRIYSENPERLNEELSKEKIIELFDEIGKDLLWIEITGGEPFLRDDLEEIVSYIYNNTGIFSGAITTNGLLTDRIEMCVRKILQKIPPKKKVIVGVSIDGLRDVYKMIRGVDGYDKSLNTFLKLRDISSEYKNLIPHIAYTISRYNAGNFAKFYEELNKKYGIGIEDFTFTLEHQAAFYGIKPSGKAERFYESFRSKIMRDISYIINRLGEENRSRGLLQKIRKSFYLFYLNKIPEFISDPTKMIIPCSAGKYSAYIDPYGTVYPCTMWDMPLGNINVESFYDIWNSEKSREVRRLIKSGRCPICWTPCEAQPSWILSLDLLRGLFRI